MPPLADSYRRLVSINGIEPWTVTSIGGVAFGDPDAVAMDDYKLPHIFAWGLIAKRESADAEMLDLLVPFAGHGRRVQALFKSGATKPSRHGAKRAFRKIAKH